MNTNYMTNVVCPKCEYEDKDSWEIDFGPGLEGEITMDCGRCGIEFVATRQCEVTYSTRPLVKVSKSAESLYQAGLQNRLMVSAAGHSLSPAAIASGARPPQSERGANLSGRRVAPSRADL